MKTKKVTYSVDKEVVDAFNTAAEQKALNKSKWLEQQMVKFIEKEVL